MHVFSLRASCCSERLSLIGFHPDFIWADVLHTVCLGIGNDLVSSVLIIMCIHGAFGAGNLDTTLNRAYVLYRKWCWDRRYTTTADEFSRKRFRYTKANAMPSSSFKAGEVKYLLFWIGEACRNWLIIGIGTFQADIATAMAACTCELCLFYDVILKAGVALTAEEIQRAVTHANRFFVFYGFLATWAFRSGKSFFRPRPKLHQFQCRLIERLTHSPINPNYFSCWGDESAVGYFCRLAKKSHTSQLARGTIMRWLLQLATVVANRTLDPH